MISSRMCRRMLAAAVALGLGAALPSCSVGPDYQRPDLGIKEQFKSTTTQPSGVGVLGSKWWALFNDVALTELENQAIAANTDLSAAAARVLQARAASRYAYGDFYPVITFDPAIQRARTPRDLSGVVTSPSGVGTGTTSSANANRARTETTTHIPFDLTYEVDIWGRVRRGVEASEAQVRSAEDDYEVVLQTLQADIAQDYFSIRSLDLQQQIFEKTVESYQRQVELTNKLKSVGVVSRIEVVQAESQLKATIAQQSDIRRQRADLEHALAVLLGRQPTELDIPFEPLDLSPPTIPGGLPSELIRRRPDVAQAEENLIAANAQVGQAIAAFYPTLQLTGAAGLESFNIRDALNWQQRIWSIGAGLTLPIFEGGKLQAQVDQAKARYDELLATYRGTVLAAIRDVEDSLTDLHLRAQQAAAQDEAVKASREYLDLTQTQFQKGVISYLLVIDAERTLLTNEITAAQIQNQRLASSVLLIKSLGGGWINDRSTTRPFVQPVTSATQPIILPTPASIPATTQPGDMTSSRTQSATSSRPASTKASDSK